MKIFNFLYSLTAKREKDELFEYCKKGDHKTLFEYYRKKSRNLFEYYKIGDHIREEKKFLQIFFHKRIANCCKHYKLFEYYERKRVATRKTILIILKEGELQTGTKYCLNFSSFRVTEALFEYNEWQNHKRKLATHIRQCMISKHCV